MANVVATLSDSELHRVVKYVNTLGVPGELRTIDILTHLSTHGAYHRGQIGRIIGKAGGESPMTDYFIYIRELPTEPKPT